jgi:hypothetical protein
MSKKSRADKQRRMRKCHRQRLHCRWAGHPVNSADVMHKALGEFLTEIGRLEFQMLLLMDLLNEAPIEAIFAETTGKPFGEKIKLFTEWCDHGAAPWRKPALKAIYHQLDALLSKRNFIVHGETREGAFKGKPRQPYRVGLVKNNLEYLDEFDRGEHGPNIFDVAQVRAATEDCRKILNDIEAFRASKPPP